MPLRSRLHVEIPKISVPSWVFGSPTKELPDTPIALDPVDPQNRTLSLSGYRRNAQRFAAGLRGAGLQTGDRVLYVSGNSLAFYAVFMGTIMAGGVFSGANPNMTAQQIAYQAEDTGCTFFLSSSAAHEKCVEALRGTDIPAKDVYLVDREVLFDAPSRHASRVHHRDWAELLGEESQGQDFDWNDHCTDPEQLVVLNYTSGSTGPPKGVMTSHRNQVANCTQWLRMAQEDPHERENVKLLSWVGWIPMIYVFGQTQFLLTGPKRGVRNYLMEAFDLDTMLDYMEKYRTTELFGIPSIATAIVNSPKAQKADLTCVTSVQIGGAPMKRPICERLERVLGHPGLAMKQGWGMTEVSAITLGWDPTDNIPAVHVGELLPNCEGKIMSIDGTTELGANERGEMLMRAPNVTQGYWKKPEQTKHAFLPDGWLRTGDLAYYDEHGKWYVIDRLRELIVTSGGHQVVPSEIESVLLDIPGVIDAGVTYVDVESGREARAFVTLDPSVNLTTEAVRAILQRKFDATQQMTAGIFALEHIPKLPGAKVDRLALRKMAL